MSIRKNDPAELKLLNISTLSIKYGPFRMSIDKAADSGLFAIIDD